MLEIDRYVGLFSQEAVLRGWQVDGVELHIGWLAENRNKLQPKYDVVVSWNVLEHVRDPLQFVRDCASFLDRGGVFCIATLDVDNWLTRLVGIRWRGLMDKDIHLHYFDRHVVKDLLSRAGLELLRVENFTQYAGVASALRGVARMLSQPLGRSVGTFTRIIPKSLMLPVKFGDMKLFVARKY